MSIRLMSRVFTANIPDIEIDCGKEKHTVKASTSKFVLLALADHANDDGKGAYPSIDTLGKKTSLQRRTVQRALDALIKNSYIMCVGVSEYGTDDYTILENNIPKGDDLRAETDDSRAEKHDPESPESSFNHTKPLRKKIEIPKGSDVAFLMAKAGVTSEEIASVGQTFAASKEKTDEYERQMGYNPLSWGSKDLAPLEKFLAKQTLHDIKRFADWSKREFSALSPAKARQYPHLVIDLWPQACPPIEVRKPEPPKEEEVYLTGEELSARLSKLRKENGHD